MSQITAQVAEYDAIIGQDQAGYYVLITELPSCLAFGETMAIAMKNIREVIDLSCEAAMKSGGHVGSHRDADDLRKLGIKVIGNRTIRVP